MAKFKQQDKKQLDIFDMAKDKEERTIDERLEDLNVGDEEEYSGREVDELNNAEPVINSYVMDEGFASSDKPKYEQKKIFEEPTSHDEAFLFPEDIEVGKEKEAKDKAKKEPAYKKPKVEAKPPLNPDFDEMSNAKKKKQTRLFAKFIVEGVCKLAEKGFIWFATKDTNEAKLMEYEISNEIDLGLLLTLEEGQQITIKKWFEGMNLSAEQIAVIGQEDKDDLSDALAEVLMEKGFAPTPMQQLIIVSVKIFLVDKGLQLLDHKMKVGAVISQLKIMRAEEVADQPQRTMPTPTAKEVIPNAEVIPEVEVEEYKYESDNDDGSEDDN